MEVRGWFLVLLLTTAVVALSALEDVSEYDSEESLEEVAQGQKCRCENGRCVTDNRGKTKCACKPGFSALDEYTCKPCDCGSLGKCIFVLYPHTRDTYIKKCVCDRGSAEKDGVCVNCYCGENSACEFDGEEKNCYCIEGYSEKDGVCTRCDCGFYGRCEFDRGNKRCECDGGYLELNGYCTECNCGPNGRCSFVNGQKTCECRAGYSVKDGVCEACNCGPNSVRCVFYNGEKRCACKDNYADRGGICEACNCGPNSYGCGFDSRGVKSCRCAEGYVQKRDMCEVGCSPANPCRNGGLCQAGFCGCPPGTSGEFCEIVNECDSLCPKQPNIGCAYDFTRQKAYCYCADEQLGYDPTRKQCKRSCDDSRRCLNGGACSPRGYDRFCDCLPGTEGDFCETVPECKYKNCGRDARCRYDPQRRTAVCACDDPGLTFDPAATKCKRTCNDNSQCRNGGICSPSGSGKFCQCKKGTEGDFCELVPGCSLLNCGAQAQCQYDVAEGRAVCQCRDSRLSFDPRDKSCKQPCIDDGTCENYGKCGGDSRVKFCICPEGTYGQFCEKIVGCEQLNCGRDALCTYDVNARRGACSCKNQDLKFDPRTVTCKGTCENDSGCKNGGRCLNKFCECLPGTTGDHCEKVPACRAMDCGPNARCAYSVDRRAAVCVCVDPKLSYDETDGTCKRGCTVVDECRNGGNCVTRGYNRFCDCLPGTRGDLCETVDDCDSGKLSCKDTSSCVFDIGRRIALCRCQDTAKAYDPVTEECKYTCHENSRCRHGGECVRRGDHNFCVCRKGTSGDLCEVVDDCARGLCGAQLQPGVACKYNPATARGICVCKNPDLRFDDASKTCKVCDCGKNAVSCRFMEGKKTCKCPEGYNVIDGVCRKVRCTQKQCLNGKCTVDQNEQEKCNCFEGYQLDGDYCQRLNCTRTPCINGTCVVRYNNREECVCQSGYSLRNGACIRGSCRIDTCFGGRCEVHDGELMCVCPEHYSLQGIGCFATVCKRKHCFGGVCVVDEETMEEDCRCYPGYVLINDVCKKIICHKPCFGGVCQVMDDGSEVCVCPDGYIMFDGLCRKDPNYRSPTSSRRSTSVWESVKSLVDWRNWLQ